MAESMGPKDARHELLRRRAHALAARAESQGEADATEAYVVFAVSGSRAGLPVYCLREIIVLPPLCEMPGLPSFLPGLIQVRGEVMSALSLHHWLELEGAATPRYAAIIEAAAGALAVLVDGIENVMEPKADDLAAMLSQDTRRARRGLTRDLVTLLDPELLLQSPELWVDQRRGRGLAAGEQVP